ncbi:hypothetical protein HK096_004387, partial [Nowakowskiella sp. JEL0078]
MVLRAISKTHLDSFYHALPVLPVCPFGASCYRLKNTAHVSAFSHATLTDTISEDIAVKKKSSGISSDKNKESSDIADDLDEETEEDEPTLETSALPKKRPFEAVNIKKESEEDFKTIENNKSENIDELAEINGIKPLILLADGEKRSVRVPKP